MFWPSKVFGFVEPFAGMPLRRGGGNRPYYQPIRSGKLGNFVPQGRFAKVDHQLAFDERLGCNRENPDHLGGKTFSSIARLFALLPER
jgi:hypothetical protein